MCILLFLRSKNTYTRKKNAKIGQFVELKQELIFYFTKKSNILFCLNICLNFVDKLKILNISHITIILKNYNLNISLNLVIIKSLLLKKI